MPVSKEEFLKKEIHQFYILNPAITCPLGWGSSTFQFLVSFPYRCYTRHLVKIGSEKKMLTHDDGRQSIAIGHLSYSGDLEN